jgi:hypothetical protein
VCGFPYQEVISRTRADDQKAVYERLGRLTILQRELEAGTRNASRLILGTSGLAETTYALWLEMLDAADSFIVDSERDQGMKRTAKVHDLAYTASRAGDENTKTDVR